MTDLNKKLEELGVGKNVQDMLNSGRSRKDSDEEYVINLCDEALGLTASRQHCFDFLKGAACVFHSSVWNCAYSG